MLGLLPFVLPILLIFWLDLSGIIKPDKHSGVGAISFISTAPSTLLDAIKSYKMWLKIFALRTQ